MLYLKKVIKNSLISYLLWLDFFNFGEKMKKLFIFCLFACQVFSDNSSEKIFSEIYERGVWGRPGFSGGGAEYKNALPYLTFLQNFMKKSEIKSVVDLGCGDWGFSQHIDWTGIEYLGIDVVKSVIEKDMLNFSSLNVKFLADDGISSDLPSADLFVCKDVFQHLTNEDILSILNQLGKFKHSLITNDIDVNRPQNNNVSIRRGEWRPIDLSAPPFNLKADKIFIYSGDLPGRYKQVFHIQSKTQE